MKRYERIKTFRDLGTDIERERFRHLYGQVEDAFGVKVLDGFVSAYTDKSGTKKIASIFFLTDLGLTECHDPLTDDHFDLDPIGGRICTIDVMTKDYDFQDATEDSRLVVDLWLTSQRAAKMQASGAACDELARVLRKWLLPNLGTAPAPRTCGTAGRRPTRSRT